MDEKTKTLGTSTRLFLVGFLLLFITVIFHPFGVTGIEDAKGSLGTSSDVKEDDIKVQADYYYQFLDDSQKKAYKILKDAYYSMEKQASFPFPLTDEEISEVVHSVLYDDTGIFWVSKSYEYVTKPSSVVVDINYRYTQEERKKIQERIDVCVDNILKGVPRGASEYERTKYIFEALANRITYEQSPYDEADQFIDATLDGTKGVCGSYARAFKYLLDKLGIPTVFVVGDAGERHAWNLVELDGEAAYADVTWGDQTDNSFINYAWLFTPKDIALSGRTLEFPETEYPDSNSYDFMFSVQSETFFQEYDSSVLTRLDSINQNRQFESVYLQFANEQEYEKALKDEGNILKHASEYKQVVHDPTTFSIVLYQ